MRSEHYYLPAVGTPYPAGTSLELHPLSRRSSQAPMHLICHTFYKAGT